MGELDLDGYMREFLDQVLPDQSRVPTGAAGGDDDPVDGAQRFGGHVQSAKACSGAFVVNPTAQGVGNSLRLLEDFLEHEMRELATFGRLGSEFELANLNLGGVGAEILNIKALAGDGRHVVIVEVNNLARVSDDR